MISAFQSGNDVLWTFTEDLRRVIGIKEADDVYPEVLLEPHNVTFCTVENLGIGRVNHNLKVYAVISPLRHLGQ